MNILRIVRRLKLHRLKKIIYIPIEVYTREIDAKLLIAALACDRGWSVVIGPKASMHRLCRHLPAGVFLGIGFHESATKIAREMKSLGHEVLSQDEEGLVRLRSDLYSEYRVSSKICDESTKVLCWGTDHFATMTSLFPNAINIVNSGNARLDLTHGNLPSLFNEEASNINARHGSFVLINGNFGSANHTKGKDFFWEELRRRGWLNTTEKKSFNLGRIEFQSQIFQEMLALTKFLCNSGVKVVVRPHPSENLAPWIELANQCEGKLEVIREGNVLSWMRAADYVVHNGCTTALEGCLSGYKIITYRPLRSPGFESELPNKVGAIAENQEQVLAAVSSASQYESCLRNESESTVAEALNCDGLAAVRIIDVAEEVIGRERKRSAAALIDIILTEYQLVKYSISKVLFPGRRSYEESKCPALDRVTIERFLRKVNQIQGYSFNLKLGELTTECLIISKRRI